MTNVLGAPASNAGDYFHFAYAVRRMLHMLHPRSSLMRIEMEGQAQEDIVVASIPKTLWAADIAEYYGGKDFVSATHVVVTQLKYSYAHANNSWTLLELCRNDKSNHSSEKMRSSTIGKLALLFEKYFEEYGEVGVHKLELRIFTNRPLQLSLLEKLKTIVDILRPLTPNQISRRLPDLVRQNTDLDKVISQLRTAAGFKTWMELGLFLRAINWQSFSQPTIDEQKRLAFQDASEYSDEFADDWWRRLFQFAIECALPARSRTILAQDVYSTLRVRPDHFFPARYDAKPVSFHQMTVGSLQVDDLVETQKKGFFLLHGVGGAGKSTAVKHLANTYQNGNAVIIYDCYGPGETVKQPGFERYPTENFITQVVNELDFYYETNILAVRTDDRRSLWQRFHEALKRAAASASQRGYRLVIAVDAVDQTVKEYNEDKSLRKNQYDIFVDDLLKIDLPENCLILFTSRPENIESLQFPSHVKPLEITGFSLAQTRDYARSYIPDITNNAISLLHEHSRGIPRIIQLTLEMGLNEGIEDWDLYIPITAKAPLEEMYRQALEDADNDHLIIRKLLAVFCELRSPVTTSVLRDVLGLSEPQLKKILSEKLRLCLIQTDDDRIGFENKNFEDFAKQYVESVRPDARNQIADYCVQHFLDSFYASDNLAFHLYIAHRFNELVSHVQENLDSRLKRLSPNQEEALEDLQYGVIAASEADQHDAGISLLVIAASLAHGSDVFARVLEQFADLAVEFNFYNKLLAHVDKSIYEHDQPSHWLATAAELARRHAENDLARGLVSQSESLIRNRPSIEKDDGFPGVPWNTGEIVALVTYTCEQDSLSSGLELLTHWRPDENMFPVFADIVREYTVAHNEIEVVSEIEAANINEDQIIYSLLGWLSIVRSQNLNEVEAVGSKIAVYLDNRSAMQEEVAKFLQLILFNLLTLTPFSPTLGRLVSFWTPEYPDSIQMRFPSKGYIYNFLRWNAMKEVLYNQPFNPSQYLFPQRPNSTSTEKAHEDYHLKAVRSILGTHYPVILARIKLLRGEIDVADMDFALEVLKHWPDENYPYHATSTIRYVSYACEYLEAICALEDTNLSLVEEIVETTVTYLSEHGYVDRLSLIDVLARKSAYFAIAEALIHKHLESIQAGKIASSERVEVILELCRRQLKMGMRTEARELFQYAREIANQWDKFGYGRSLALTFAAKAVQRNGQQLTITQSNELVTIFDYVNQVTSDERGSHFEDVLRILARDQFEVSLAALQLAEAQKQISIGDGVSAIGQGLLDATPKFSSLTWPLIHLMKYPDGSLLKQCATHLSNTSVIIQMLETWAWRIRLIPEADVQERQIKDFIACMKELALTDFPLYARMKAQYDIIAQFPSRYSTTYTASENSDKAEFLFSNEPSQAFETIKTYFEGDMRSESHGFSAIRLLRKLTTQQRVDLAKLIALRNYTFLSPRSIALDALIEIAESVKVHPYQRNNANIIMENISIFVMKNLYSFLSYFYYPSERKSLERLARSNIIEDKKFFKTILSAAGHNLTQLSADQMYLTLAYLSERFSKNPGEIFDQLRKHALNSIDNTPFSMSVSTKPPEGLLLNFLCDYLGDPRFEFKWKAVHAIVDLILLNPEIALPHVFERAKDETHSRWMDVREWSIFVIYHIALRKPSILEAFVDEIVFHVRNPMFPHAKIREQAKQILLAIASNNPNSVSADVIVSLEQVNVAQELKQADHKDELLDSLNNDKEIGWSTELFDEMQESETPETDLDFHFKDWHMHDNGFEEIAKIFEVPPREVNYEADLWGTKWNISAELFETDLKELRKRFGEDHIYFHFRGEIPPIVGLEGYFEKHALQLIAGKWIESRPVPHKRNYDYHTWGNWIRKNIFDIDPTIVGRFVDSPSLNSAAFLIPPKDFNEWASLSNTEKFLQTLSPELDSDGWLIISERHQAVSYDFQETVDIRSVAVSRELAEALGRAIASASPEDSIYLPEYQILDDVLLSDIEQYIVMNDLSDNVATFEDEEDEAEQIPTYFTMYPSTVSWHFSDAIGGFDSYWSNSSKNLLIPSSDIVHKMNLVRQPLTLDYHDDAGNKVARFGAWHIKLVRDQEVSGSRLMLRRDLLQSYLNKMQQSLVIKVNIVRNRPYSYSRDDDEQRDIHGKTVAFVFDAEGQLRQC